MTVKLNSLVRWAFLDPKEAIVLEDPRATERRVRIDFNLEGVTSFFIGDEHGENFLCTIGPGVETLEFYASGTFNVYAEEGSGAVHYYCAEHEPTFKKIVDPVIFTKIAKRRHRNPELEEMMFRMNQNIERRLASQADEIKAFYEAQRKAAENVEPVVNTDPAPVPAGTGGAQVPAQSPAGEKPGEAPASDASGEQPGGGGTGAAGGTVPS